LRTKSEGEGCGSCGCSHQTLILISLNLSASSMILLSFVVLQGLGTHDGVVSFPRYLRDHLSGAAEVWSLCTRGATPDYHVAGVAAVGSHGVYKINILRVFQKWLLHRLFLFPFQIEDGVNQSVDSSRTTKILSLSILSTYSEFLFLEYPCFLDWFKFWKGFYPF
jgi:hypothetical protein